MPVAEVEPEPLCSGDGARVDLMGRLGTCRCRRSAALILPEDGRNLGPGRVVGANEENRAIRLLPAERKAGNSFVSQRHIATPPVTARCRARDQARFVQDSEMVGQQVGPQVVACAEVLRGLVGRKQILDDRQTDWIAEGGKGLGSLLCGHNGMIAQNILR